jgi:hypothetical protein
VSDKSYYCNACRTPLLKRDVHDHVEEHRERGEHFEVGPRDAFRSQPEVLVDPIAPDPDEEP